MDNVVIDEDGDTVWYDSNGYFHRDDGPAIENAHGTKTWFQHGKVHRDDGPAVEYADGDKEWHLHDIRLSFDEWLNDVKMADRYTWEQVVA